MGLSGDAGAYLHEDTVGAELEGTRTPQPSSSVCGARVLNLLAPLARQMVLDWSEGPDQALSLALLPLALRCTWIGS